MRLPSHRVIYLLKHSSVLVDTVTCRGVHPPKQRNKMQKFEWDDSFKIGFREIDLHHRRLFELFQKTHDGFINGVPNLGPIFDELFDYTRYHFKSEEVWMIDKFYPEVEKHKREHDSFLCRVNKSRESFKSGQEYLSMETLTFLREWIVGHILSTDAEFGRFIRDSGR